MIEVVSADENMPYMLDNNSPIWYRSGLLGGHLKTNFLRILYLKKEYIFLGFSNAKLRVILFDFVYTYIINKYNNLHITWYLDCMMMHLLRQNLYETRLFASIIYCTFADVCRYVLCSLKWRQIRHTQLHQIFIVALSLYVTGGNLIECLGNNFNNMRSEHRTELDHMVQILNISQVFERIQSWNNIFPISFFRTHTLYIIYPLQPLYNKVR